jgi:hypothetical protein
MIPFLRTTSIGEEKYNKAHTKTRRIVENAFGVLKSRFRCLDRSGGEIQFTPKRCCNVIITCCVLHNIAIEKGLPLPENILSLNNYVNNFYSNNNTNDANIAGITKRNELVMYFANL